MKAQYRNKSLISINKGVVILFFVIERILLVLLTGDSGPLNIGPGVTSWIDECYWAGNLGTGGVRDVYYLKESNSPNDKLHSFSGSDPNNRAEVAAGFRITTISAINDFAGGDALISTKEPSYGTTKLSAIGEAFTVVSSTTEGTEPFFSSEQILNTEYFVASILESSTIKTLFIGKIGLGGTVTIHKQFNLETPYIFLDYHAISTKAVIAMSEVFGDMKACRFNVDLIEGIDNSTHNSVCCLNKVLNLLDTTYPRVKIAQINGMTTGIVIFYDLFNKELNVWDSRGMGDVDPLYTVALTSTKFPDYNGKPFETSRSVELFQNSQDLIIMAGAEYYQVYRISTDTVHQQFENNYEIRGTCMRQDYQKLAYVGKSGGDFVIGTVVLSGVGCHADCAFCGVDGDPLACLKCQDQAKILTSYGANGGVCSPPSACPSGKFIYSSEICIPCQAPCATCEDTKVKCLTCIAPLFAYNYSCGSSCPAGLTTAPTSGGCEACDIQCLTCKNSPSDCLTCAEGYIQNSSDSSHCRKILKLKSKYFSMKKLEVKLSFEKRIKNKDFTKVTKMTLNSERDDSTGQKLTFSSERNTDRKSVVFKIANMDSIENGVITLKTTSIGIFEGEKFDTQYTEETIELTSISYYASGLSQLLIESKPVVVGVVTTTTLVTLFSSFSFGLSLLRLIQRIEILSYVNVALPLNYMLFLEMFSDDIFDITPSLIPRIPNNTICTVHQKLDENDRDCYIFNSSGHLFTQIIIIFFIKLVIVGIVKLLGKMRINNLNQVQKNRNSHFSVGSVEVLNSSKFPKSLPKKGCKEKTTNIIAQINENLNLVLLISCILGLQTDLLLPAFVNLRNLQFKGAVNFICSFITLFVIAFYLVFLSLMTYKLLKSYQTKGKENLNQTISPGEKSLLNNIQAHWVFMVEELKPITNKVGLFTHHYTYFRDFLMSFFMIVFIDYPLIQIIPSILMVVWNLMILMKYRPYKNYSMNFISILNESVFLVILAFLLLLDLVDTEKERNNIFGYLLITILGISMIANIVVGFRESYILIREKCKKWKKKRKITPKKSEKVEDTPTRTLIRSKNRKWETTINNCASKILMQSGENIKEDCKIVDSNKGEMPDSEIHTLRFAQPQAGKQSLRQIKRKNNEKQDLTNWKKKVLKGKQQKGHDKLKKEHKSGGNDDKS